MEPNKYGRRVQEKTFRVTEEDIQDIIALINESGPVEKVAVIRPLVGPHRKLSTISRLFKRNCRTAADQLGPMVTKNPVT